MYELSFKDQIAKLEQRQKKLRLDLIAGLSVDFLLRFSRGNIVILDDQTGTIENIFTSVERGVQVTIKDYPNKTGVVHVFGTRLEQVIKLVPMGLFHHLFLEAHSVVGNNFGLQIKYVCHHLRQRQFIDKDILYFFNNLHLNKAVLLV